MPSQNNPSGYATFIAITAIAALVLAFFWNICWCARRKTVACPVLGAPGAPLPEGQIVSFRLGGFPLTAFVTGGAVPPPPAAELAKHVRLVESDGPCGDGRVLVDVGALSKITGGATAADGETIAQKMPTCAEAAAFTAADLTNRFVASGNDGSSPPNLNIQALSDWSAAKLAKMCNYTPDEETEFATTGLVPPRVVNQLYSMVEVMANPTFCADNGVTPANIGWSVPSTNGQLMVLRLSARPTSGPVFEPLVELARIPGVQGVTPAPNTLCGPEHLKTSAPTRCRTRYSAAPTATS
jgi:hypothetical protein